MDWDSTRELAAAVGLQPDGLLSELGQFEPVTIADQVGGSPAGATWWGSGQPMQVLLGVDQQGQVWVAEPRLSFRGPVPVTVAHRPERLLRGADRVAQVNGVTVRTRRRFRYCRQCRTASPPEYFNTDLGVCDGCSQAWGVVF